MKRVHVFALTSLLAACGTGAVAVEENPIRADLEQAIAGIDTQKPLVLRYNPAACACPPTELRVGDQWLRAELVGDANVQTWLTGLSRTSPDNLPTPLQVLGRVDREILRTPQGSYAARIDVQKVLPALPATAATGAP